MRGVGRMERSVWKGGVAWRWGAGCVLKHPWFPCTLDKLTLVLVPIQIASEEQRLFTTISAL